MSTPLQTPPGTSPKAKKRVKLSPTWSSERWVYGFLLLQFACQAALIAPLGSARILFRITTYASSIAMLGLLTGRGKRHPLRQLALIVIAVMMLGLLHPDTNTPLAALGAIGMYLSIWGPLFWVGRMRLTPEILARAMLLIWAFHSLSAALGVLQVYDPDRFSPDATFVESTLGEFAEGLKVKLDDGRKVYRPFGLTDSPGGAATSGCYAATLGLVIALSRRPPWLRLLAALSAAIGMFCIYICQFRSALIVTCIGFAIMIAITASRGQTAKSLRMIAVIGLAVLGGFVWAVAIGGESVTKRLETLTKDDAATVYYSNRGIFLESTVNEDIPNYPLGAGLGRWGMMNTYFGDHENPESSALWAEIQPTAWVFDGGVILLVVGYAAVIAACVMSAQMALRSTSVDLSENAAAICAMNLSTLASSFGYPIFMSQGGILFWFLNAMLYTAVVRTQFSAPKRRTS